MSKKRKPKTYDQMEFDVDLMDIDDPSNGLPRDDVIAMWNEILFQILQADD